MLKSQLDIVYTLSHGPKKLCFAATLGAVAIASTLSTSAHAQMPGGNGSAGFGLNVRTFGAVGDCKHDDTGALQSAALAVSSGFQM